MIWRTARFAAMVGLIWVAACAPSRARMSGGEQEAMCSPTCGAGATCCGTRCAYVLTDNSNCGGCGVVCSGGQQCSMGQCMGIGVSDSSVPRPDSAVTVDAGPSSCTMDCGATRRCCGGSCVNLTAPTGQLDARTDTSFQHCNGCGLACDSVRSSNCGALNGTTTCKCGNWPQCAPGQACLPGSDGALLCRSLQSDPMNCGALGNRCGEGESCTNGVCGCGGAGQCAAGQGCCNGACVDVTSDAMNCGACGNACGANAPTCAGGMCRCGTGNACTPFNPMNPTALGEVCCNGSCQTSDAANCGACGESCSSGQACIVGLGIGSFSPELCCGMEGQFVCLPELPSFP